MRGWLVYTPERLERNAAYARMHKTWCKERGIELKVVVIADEPPFLSSADARLPLPDFAIFRCENTSLRYWLEQRGVVVANSSRIGIIANDKLASYEFARDLGIPHLEAHRLSRGAVGRMGYPLVIKPRGGHGGAGVQKVCNAEQLRAFAQAHIALGTESAWLCQRVSPVEGKDLRVYVLGGRVLACMLRTAPIGAFLSNYCLGGAASRYELSAAEARLVDKISQALGDGYYGIDFLFDANGRLLFNEIEDVVGSRMLYANTSIDAVHEHLSHVVGLVRKRSGKPCNRREGVYEG
ncbi:MAG: ATP-grasp domain-containing protein [Coriobacteriales bacterium]|nr:ATP-grasp domain-containing protein [Coriobacteriales bacterium]